MHEPRAFSMSLGRTSLVKDLRFGICTIIEEPEGERNRWLHTESRLQILGTSSDE